MTQTQSKDVFVMQVTAYAVVHGDVLMWLYRLIAVQMCILCVIFFWI